MKNSLFENISAGSFTIILHVALFALIFVGIDFQSTTHVTAQPKVDIVQATAMDEADVLAEMTRQQEYEDDKRQQEQERQDKIDKKFEQAEQELEDKKQEIVEQQQQAELEQQQRKLEAEQKQQEIEVLKEQRKIEEEKKQQAEVERKLEEQKKQQAEQERLAEEERKQIVAEERRAEEEKKRLAEADRKAAEQKKRDAEERVRKAEEEEKEKQRLAKIAEEKKKAEEKAAHEAKVKADREAAVAAKLKAQRDEAAKLLQDSLDAEAREQETMRINGVVDKHVSIIRQRVKRYWIKPSSAERGLQSTLQVSLLPSGEVKVVKVVKSSGNILFDRSAENAVYKASPLPVPTDPKALAKFKQFSFNFKPE
ncbi:MAG: protein TolA [Methylophaga sp.]|nr:MAG: protein TolA [Methylophaga sp.]